MPPRHQPSTKCCLLSHLHAGSARGGAAHVCTPLLPHEDPTHWRQLPRITDSVVRGLRKCYPNLFDPVYDVARYGDLRECYVCRRAWDEMNGVGKPSDGPSGAVATVDVARSMVKSGYNCCTASELGCNNSFKRSKDGSKGKPRPGGGDGRVCLVCYNKLKRAKATAKPREVTPRSRLLVLVLY